MRETVDFARHTPGPWTAFECAIEGPFTPKGRQSIGIVCKAFSGMEAQARANACLVAAAPELLAAVRALLDAYGPLVIEDDSRIELCADALALGDLAIAKAEGRDRPGASLEPASAFRSAAQKDQP